MKLLIERCLDGEPEKRPSMGFVFEIMKTLDSLINKEALRPLVLLEDDDQNQTDSLESNKEIDQTTTRKYSGCEKTVLNVDM